MSNKLIDELYQRELSDSKSGNDKISRDPLISFIKNLKMALFCNYFSSNFSKSEIEKYLSKANIDLKDALGVLYEESRSKIEDFFSNIINIRDALMLDVEAIYQGDPASSDYQQIISTYPGFTAIFCYRVAHFFYLKGMSHLSRIISEYAHSRTGIDIHPGATIGESFFIDHGTGIVIGETAVIGNRCKLYQGVTLGALSLKDGRALQNKKRHPTLLDNVVIYSGSSVFGGDTIIGNNVTIGANLEVRESVPDNKIIRGNCGN